jgi:glycosyltransferase involved in cell wall biosynthesis
MGPVQVIIPAFNSPVQMLEEAIASALSEPDVESLLVIDDGSDPPIKLAAAENRNRRVRVLQQPNRGPSAARNLGIDHADAPFILLLDHDDALEPGGLAAGLALAERLSAAAVVSARYEQRGVERKLKEVPEAWGDRRLPIPGEIFRPLAIFGASGLLLRRSCLEQVRFDPALLIGEDRDFLRRVANAGPIAVNRRPMLTVRLHDHGDNLTSPGRMARRVQDHLLILQRHYDQTSDQPLREQTIWLLNMLARQRPLDVRLWRTLRAAAKGYGWEIPLKSRVRVWGGALAHGE